MSATAKNLKLLTKDDLIALEKEGIKNREMRLSTANSKGRKLGFLGAEYAQRQNSQYLRQHTSETIGAALMTAGMIAIWNDDLRGPVFAFTDEDGSIPDDFKLPSVTAVEQCVRNYVSQKEDEAASKPRSRK